MPDHHPGDVIESNSTRQGAATLHNLGLYAQAGWSRFAPYLEVTGGLRYDNHSRYGNQMSGRIGLVSSPLALLHFKLLYGAAFKAPAPLLLYGVSHQVRDIEGNESLQPQKVRTAETQVLLTPSENFSFSTGVSVNNLTDKAEFVQQGLDRVADNISKMCSYSLESELSWSYRNWIRTHLSFERQWASRQYVGYNGAYNAYLLADRNVIYPDYIIRAGVYAGAPFVPVRVGIRMSYVGKRRSSEMNAIENVGMYELPAYFMLGAHLATQGIKLMDDRETVFSVAGRNLTNRKVADPGFTGIDYPLSPLTIFFEVSQQL